MNPKKFFGELKRRNVYKVAIAYGVVAWLVLQAASILFPTFEAPPWMMKVFVAVIAFGFPIALIIAWAFELTPEGLKRTEFADELPTKAPRSNGQTIWIADAHRDDGKRFVVGADDKLTAFVELESTIRGRQEARTGSG
jgi:hypothetical protein